MHTGTGVCVSQSPTDRTVAVGLCISQTTQWNEDLLPWVIPRVVTISDGHALLSLQADLDLRVAVPASDCIVSVLLWFLADGERSIHF